VVITGVSTNVAIPNATFDCVNAGFNVVIARDAITGHPADYTDVIIKNTLSLVAKICTTDELVEIWS
jgi:nicotinamidase-related amidase